MIKKIKENIGKYILYGTITLFTGLIGLGVYSKIWESRQQKEEIENVVIKSIQPYCRRSGDLYWLSKSYRIFIEGENKPIEFLSKHWDDSVKEGDIVDLVVRESCPLFEEKFYGLTVKMAK